MFGKRSPEANAYRSKVKEFGGCPPCSKCQGAGWTGDMAKGTEAACDPCWSTGIDPGPGVPPKSQHRGKRR